MINFLDLNDYKKGLKPVTSSEYFVKTDEFHPDGLFSENIFGPIESLERKKTFSYIQLHNVVLHPSAYELILRLDKRIEKYLSTESKFIIKKGELIEDENGESGIQDFKKNFLKIKFRGGTDVREKFIKKLHDSFKKNLLFIDAVPVIPPHQRDMYKDESGTWIIDPLNDYYIKIIRRNHQLKGGGVTGELFDLLNFELQKSILDHNKFIRSKIEKKHGLIRGQMMGKRVDFSGRGVIVTRPDLRSDEIELPLKMAVNIFEPFISHIIFYTNKVDKEKLNKLIKDYTNLQLSTDSLKSVIKSISSGDKLPQELYNIIFQVTEMAMHDRVVLAKRDPCLKDLSIRGFKPKLTKNDSIGICPLVVKGFNADFDGDTMGIFHPLSKESQEEVKAKMMRTYSSEHNTETSFKFTKEMGVGIYLITKDVKRTTPPILVTEADLEKATDPYIPVKYRNRNTTMGKALFNSVFPSNFPFYDDVATNKTVNNLIPKFLDVYGEEQTKESFSKLEKIAFKFATIMGPNISLDHVDLPPNILKLKKQLETSSTEQADKIIGQMEKELEKHLRNTGLHDLIVSGSAKGWGQTKQILLAKGLVTDSEGKVLPVISKSIADGYSSKDYFNSAYGARVGIMKRVLMTAPSGYMSRKLIYLLQKVEAHSTLKDCKTNRTLSLKLNSNNISRFGGRYVIKNGKLILFEEANFKVGDIIKLRSPIYCESQKICHTCYGKLLERHRTPYIGILAGQAVGEKGTQLTMVAFHTGGSVSMTKRNMLNDIVTNDPIAGLEL